MKIFVVTDWCSSRIIAVYSDRADAMLRVALENRPCVGMRAENMPVEYSEHDLISGISLASEMRANQLQLAVD